jgi:alcohol dehydrogenase class IV
MLLRTLPPQAIAEPGMDALVHAVESFISSSSSPLTDGLGLEAIRLIAENLRPFYSNPDDLEAASHMLVASTMAGIAFGNGRTGVVHAMAHALGGFYDVGHGLSCGLILPHAMKFCLSAVPEKFIRIAKAMGENTEALSLMDAAARSVRAVEHLIEDIHLPKHLRELGVKEYDISQLAENAITTGIHVSTPKQVTLQNVAALFREAF